MPRGIDCDAMLTPLHQPSVIMFDIESGQAAGVTGER